MEEMTTNTKIIMIIVFLTIIAVLVFAGFKKSSELTENNVQTQMNMNTINH